MSRYLIQHQRSGDVFVTDWQHISDALYYTEYRVVDGDDLRPDLDLADFELDNVFADPDHAGDTVDDFRVLLIQGWDGGRLVSLRARLGWSQTELADEINRQSGMRVHRHAVSRWESGGVAIGGPAQRALDQIERAHP